MTDISNPEVQDGRHKKRIPYYSQLTLHDCVPLFFAPKPPMLSSRREQQTDIFYLHISPQVLLLPQVVFTDGNARNNSTKFFIDLKEFEKIDWIIMKAKYWGSDDEEKHKENKRRRSAEVLVPNNIPACYIQSISAMTKSAFDRASDVLKKADKKITITINPELYFPMNTVAKQNGGPSALTQPLEPPDFPEDWDTLIPPPDIEWNF